MNRTRSSESLLSMSGSEVAMTTASGIGELLTGLNLFRIMANADSLYPVYVQYVRALVAPLELDASVNAMIGLYVAKQSDCFYAWRLGVAVAKRGGVSQAQIDALELGEMTADCFSFRQKIALRFTDEVMQLIEVREPTLRESKRFFSDRAITEMLYVIGNYMFFSRLLRTGRVPLDDSLPALSNLETGFR